MSIRGFQEADAGAASARFSTGLRIDELFAAELDRMKRRRLERYPRIALAWLAALPEVTHRLAEALGLPFQGFSSLDALMGDLVAESLLEATDLSAPDGSVSMTYWMSPAGRVEVGAFLRGDDPSAVRQAVAELLGRLRSVDEPDAHTPALRLWSEVAARYGQDLSGRGLLAFVDDLLLAGDGNATLALVKAAESLGNLVGEPLESAARRAQWRVDRAFRQALDARALTTYLPRPELEAHIAHFIGDPRFWALHIVGDGGLGKTMTIRQLASGRLARQWSLGELAVARIDFDHLDPRFPERRPAELLVALAQELEVYTESRQAEQLATLFADTARAVHDRMSSHRVSAEQSGLDSAVAVFADFVASLRRRVVLVVDTCEELAKLHAPQAESPAIESTFTVLQRVHEMAPGTRVILAGRRWLVPRPTGPAGLAGAPHLRPRAYLDVFQINGFDPAQAEQYVDLRDPDGRIPPALRKAVLLRASRGRSGECVPFDLACYVAWALAQPDLDADALRSAEGDPYVEQRILGRLAGPGDTDVRDALPILVELGRFDADTLRHALPPGVDHDRVFASLVGQEWITATAFTSDGRPRTLEVDDHLRARLRTLARDRAGQFRIDRTAVGRRLAGRALVGRVEEVSVELVEAAVRMLPPAEAGTFWDELSRRIAEQEAWAWAGQMLPRVAAAEAERGSDGPSILAAIRALQALAGRHAGLPDQPGLWSDVGRQARRHPDADTARRLAIRAAAGAAGADPRHLGGLADVRDDDLPLVADSLLVAVNESLARGQAWPQRSALLDRMVDGTPDPGLRAGVLLARAADRLVRGRSDLALADLDAATSLGRQLGSDPTTMTYWWPPPRFGDRIRGAIVHVHREQARPPADRLLDDWIAEAAEHLDDPDAQALIATAVDQQLDWRAAVSLPFEVPMAVAGPPPTDFWVRRSRPLFVVAADALAAGGSLGRAADLLVRRRDLALRSPDQGATVAECDAALVRLSREFRVLLSTAVRDGKRSSDPAVRGAAWAASALVEGTPPASPADAGGWHEWWQAQITPDAAQLEWAGAILAAGRSSRQGPGPTGPDLVLRADAAEIEALGATPASDPRRAGPVPPVAGAPWPAPGPQDAVGATLRMVALQGADVPSVVSGLAPRSAALLALREAELMALRLPGAALPLLQFAVRGLSSVGDEFGRLRAAALVVLTADRAALSADDLPPDVETLLDTAAWSSLHVDSDPVASGWQARVGLARRIRGEDTVGATGAMGSGPELVRSPALVRRWGWRRSAPATTTAPPLDLDSGSIRLQQKSVILSVEPNQISWSACDVAGDRDLLSVRPTPRRRPVRRVWHPSEPDLPKLDSNTPYLVVPLVLPPSRYGDGQDLERDVCDTIQPTGLDPLMVRFLAAAGSGDRAVGWRKWSADARELPNVYRGPSHLRSLLPLTAESSAPACFLRHLVGLPVPTSAGWGFRVRSSGSTPVAPLSSSAAPRSVGTGSTAPGGPLLIDDLISVRTEMLVLQMDPVDAPPEPLGKLRGGMTAVCLDVVASGSVGVVLAIPALPDVVAGEVAALLWSFARDVAVGPDTGRPDMLLDMTYRIRSTVARAAVGVPRFQEQPWLDVMLYLRA